MTSSRTAGLAAIVAAVLGLTATHGACGQSCGAPTAGDCFAANGTPFCDDQTCCDLVCALDPFCCDTAWDGICADLAFDQCQFPTTGCCLPDLSCVDVTSLPDCLALTGELQSSGTLCADMACTRVQVTHTFGGSTTKAAVVDVSGGDDGAFAFDLDATDQMSEGNLILWDGQATFDGSQNGDFDGTGSAIGLFAVDGLLGPCVDEVTGRQRDPLLPATFSAGPFGIEQFTFVDNDRQYVIYQWTITNSGPLSIPARLIFPLDWDLFDDSADELTGWDPTRRLAFQQDSPAAGGDPDFTTGGVALIRGQLDNFRLGFCCDMTDLTIIDDYLAGIDVGDQDDDSDADKEVVVSAELGTLAPGATRTVAFVQAAAQGLSAADGLANLQAEIDAAIACYATIPVAFTGPMLPERAHPGWNRVSAEITLTPNQPTYWSALSGTGSVNTSFPVTLPPFPSLDPDPTGVQPGRPCPDGSGERCLRGYIVAWAVDADNREIAYDQLSGSATVVDYQRHRAWAYGAWTHQSVGPVVGDGVLNLDGNEYSPGFDLLLLDFFVDASTPFATDTILATTVGDLTLHPLDVDVQQGSTPVTTKAVIDVWNENEVKFDGLDRCITCWDQTLFANYAGFGVPNNLVNLQTNKGKARIDGRAGDGICDIFDETEGPCGTLSTDVCGEDVALTGVVAHHLECIVAPPSPDVLGFSAFGKNLVGMGTQSASIQYTPLDPPPTATAPRDRRGERSASLRASRTSSRPAAAAGSPVQDRASGTEKGSLLYISKVELRWNADGELIQDTFISLLNDGNEAVKVQMEFINGDPPLEAVGP